MACPTRCDRDGSAYNKLFEFGQTALFIIPAKRSARSCGTFHVRPAAKHIMGIVKRALVVGPITERVFALGLHRCQ